MPGAALANASEANGRRSACRLAIGSWRIQCSWRQARFEQGGSSRPIVYCHNDHVVGLSRRFHREHPFVGRRVIDLGFGHAETSV